MAGVRLGSYVVPWQSASPAQGVHCGNVLTNVATPPPSACHCEPVRTLVRQSVSPQGNFASWQYLGQIRSFYVFAGNSCVLLCAAARRTDCPVASLLAMTCRNMAGVRLGSYVVPWQSASPAQGVHCGNVLTNVATPPPSACHCEPVLGPPQRGTLCGERSPKEALLPRWPSAGGEHGGLWGDEVWQSASPQGNFASWQYLGQIRSFYVFAGNSGVLLCAAAGDADCHVASLLAMTEGGGTSLHPRIRTRLLHVIANQCAHWCGNPHPRRETLQVGNT